MPLVIFSGYPCSGISTRATQLKKYLDEINNGQIKDIVVISDETIGIQKEAYKDRESEKLARGAQFGHVQRALATDKIVILDNMSYIKGFRYQLFCEAKALQTTACVVHVGTPKELCKQWNAERPNAWESDLLDALIFRYEEPNSMNRWDSPLFLLTPEDRIPIKDIWDVLVLKKALKANAATVLKPAASSDFLSVLNDTTSAITKEIMAMHKDAPGAQITIAGRELVLPYRLTLAQMSRIRRNFIQLNKSADIPADSIKGFYIDFVQSNWDIES